MLTIFIFDAFEGMAMFLTMFSAVINLRKGSFTYAGSAHPAVILWNHKENKFLKLDSQNTIIGYEKKDESQFRQDVIMMSAQDKIIMYTDGIIETEDANHKQLGINGLIEFFKPSIYLSVDEIVDTIMTGLQQFTPHPIRDDVYLILASLK